MSLAPDNFQEISRAGWRAYATDFYDDGNGTYVPFKAMDANTRTAWLQSPTAGYPHELWFDMGRNQSFNAILFLRRQDGPEDSPGHVQVLISDDGNDWSDPVGEDTWLNTSDPLIMDFGFQTGRWIKLRMLDAAAGSRGYVSCAEFLVGYGKPPFSIDCSCLESKCACLPSELIFHAKLDTASYGGWGIFSFVLLVGGPEGAGITPTPGPSVEISQVLSGSIQDWIDNWGRLQVNFGGFNSAFQPPNGNYATATATWSIEIKYTCVSEESNFGGGSEFAVNAEEGAAQCHQDGLLKVITAAGAGGGASTLFTSSGLGFCDEGGMAQVWLGGFSPAPHPKPCPSQPPRPCVCPVGGTGPFQFSLASGLLPSGQSIDPDTGCITGAPDGGSQGTSDITIQAVDAQGNIAQTKCATAKVECAKFGNSFL